MEKEIISVIKYFSFFAYQPTFQEIHTFSQTKISKNELKSELDRLKYTPPQYSIRRKISKKKLKNWRFQTYIKLLSLFPQIKLVGLSGSISMMNADLDDDIDLFIIIQKERLYTGRFLATIFAYIMGLKRGLKRNKAPNKVCLNLFFDENNLRVPKFKQTEFVGHEVLQMKPVIVKGNVYERFLKANRWVFKLFPNAITNPVIPAKVIDSEASIAQTRRAGIQTKNTWIPSYEGMTRLFGTWNLGFRISNKIESFLKNLQLKLINRHKTTEIITSTQLWFHPDDFEKRIKKLKG